MRPLILALPWLAGLLACSSTNPVPNPPAPSLQLHVPSPDWSEQIIYFIFTDRFANGDPGNDDQGAGEYDPSDFRRYSGGDLQGIIDRLDYIQSLGATAIWITPPVANQWWDPRSEFGGFHGYWARHLKQVDEHQGTLDTYRRLSDALHRRGMYLIQDIVPNHMGNFFSYDGAYNPEDPAENFVLNSESVPTAAPEQAPFDQIDINNPDHRNADIYHFTPGISNFNDPVQETEYALSDLDDLNTENPVVRDALRDNYGFWIREVGIDGVRIDTVKFIEPSFWPDFLHGDHPNAPSLEDVAVETGRDGFLTFGEIFEVSDPFDDAAEQKIGRYFGTSDAPALDSALAFPLYASITRVLTQGRPTQQLAYRLERLVDRSLVPNPFLSPTFIDNHDVQRFLATGTRESFLQALLLIMSLPGIPVIYQGTEQEFEETRAAMFAGGWSSDNRDHYDTTSDVFQYIQNLAGLRTTNPVLTKGTLSVFRGNPTGPGVLAFTRTLGQDSALVLLNTSAARVLVDNLPVDLSAGAELTLLAGTAEHTDLVVNTEQQVVAELPPQSAFIFTTTGNNQNVSAPDVSIALDTTFEGQVFTEDIAITGTSTGASELVLVFNENLDNPVSVNLASNGTFTTTLALDRFRFGQSTHTMTVYEPIARFASERFTISIDRQFDGMVFQIEDPEGDDAGPEGNYGYPTDSTFGNQMDIVGIDVESGGTLTLRFRMAEVTSVWNPDNGFDHVCFNVFFDIPGQDGLTLMPRLNANTPSGFNWDIAHFAFGWGNTLYTTQGATADEQGASLDAAPLVSTDESNRTIAFTYDPVDFGLATFDGVSVYVTTWDFDGLDARFRDLDPAGGPFIVRGPQDGAKVMDAVGPFSATSP